MLSLGADHGVGAAPEPPALGVGMIFQFLPSESVQKLKNHPDPY
jgi:hypothetical protein